MKRRSSLLAIRDLCSQGLPTDELVPALLEALHELVPSHRNLFDWTDEQGRLQRYFFEGPIDVGIAQRYFEVFHNRRECECMPAFASISDEPGGVRGAEMQDQPAFYESALYREIWRPQGLHTRIEGVVRDVAGRLQGSLVLYRGPGDPRFEPEDEQALAQVLPYLAFGLRLGLSGDGQARFVPSPEPSQTAVVDAGGQIRLATPGFVGALLAAQGEVSPRTLTEPLAQRLERVMQMLRPAPFQSRSQDRLGLTLANASGRWSLSAVPLYGSEGAGVVPLPSQLLTLRRLEPLEVALARVLRAWSLTPGQSQIARALYAGLGQKEIATQLGVAPATVVDHVRKLYLRLEIGSATALRGLIDDQLNRLAA